MAIQPSSLPASDMVSQIISTLFGPGWESTAVGGGTPTFLNSVISNFNTIACSAVGVLFIVTMFKGAMATAHDGSAGGKNMHTIWAPLRIATAALGNAPAFSGISVAQGILFLTVAWSLTFANQMWDLSVDSFTENGARLTAAAPTRLHEDVGALAEGILRSEVLQATAYYEQALGTPGNRITTTPQWIPDEASETGGGAFVMYMNSPKDLGLEREMGTITVPCTSPDSPACAARMLGVAQLLADLNPIAYTLASTGSVPERARVKPKDFGAALEKYEATVLPTLREMITEQQGQLSDQLTNFKDSAKSAGFMGAGMFYWTISRLNERINEDITAGVNYSAPSLRAHSDVDPRFWEPSVANRNLETMGVYLERARQYPTKENELIEAAKAGVDTKSAWGKVRVFLNALFYDWSFPMVVKAFSEKDPIAAMSNMGHSMIGGIETALTAWLGINMTQGGMEGAQDTAPGMLTKWFGSNVVVRSLGRALEAASPFIVILVIAAFVFAFTLAFYVPSMPFIVMVSAVVNYIVQLTEAIFLVPVWMVALAMPEGEGMAGEHGKAGVLIILGLLLRAPLMVAGFLTSMVLISGVGKVIGQAFIVFGFSVNSGHVSGLPSSIAMVVIFSGLMTVLIHGLLELTTRIPDYALQWVGRQMGSSAVEKDINKVHGNFSGADRQAREIAQGGNRELNAPATKGASPSSTQVLDKFRGSDFS